MRFWLVLFCCLAASVQAQDTVLQTCLDLARRQPDYALDLAGDCPLLFRELQDSGLLDSISPPFNEPVGLTQLELLAESLRSRHGVRPIRQDGLDTLLAGVLTDNSSDPEQDWWQTFLKWLDSFKSEKHEAQYQWLQRWLQALTPSEQAAKIFFFATILLLVALSLWLVVSELYRAGVFRRFSRQGKPLADTESPPPARPSSSRLRFEQLTPKAEIGALLGQLISVLAERKLLPEDSSLTHRQLADYVVRETSGLAPAFSRLVYRSEPLLYGKDTVDGNMVGDYRREIQQLLANITA